MCHPSMLYIPESSLPLLHPAVLLIHASSPQGETPTTAPGMGLLGRADVLALSLAQGKEDSKTPADEEAEHSC